MCTYYEHCARVVVILKLVLLFVICIIIAVVFVFWLGVVYICSVCFAAAIVVVVVGFYGICLLKWQLTEVKRGIYFDVYEHTCANFT